MAYGKRSYRGKRRARSSQSWYEKKYSTLQIAKQALNGVKYIKGLVNSEMLHIVNQGNVSLDVAASPTVLHLTNIAQGDTTSGRTGNSILLRGIQCRFEFVNSSTAPATLYRVMLVMDTQTVSDNTTLATTDILESNSTLAWISTSTSGRFKVLKNWFFTTNSVSTYTRSVQYFKDMHTHVRWNGTATTDIQKNAIYLIAFSDQALANRPTMAYNIKLNYHDN